MNVGVWDSFTFTLVSTESTKVSGLTYEREKGIWDGANYNYPLYQGQATTYAKTAKDTLILNSDWINEEVQKWLVRELYESPNVYLEQGENFEPVNVVNSGYQFKQRRINGLIQEVVEIQRTYLYNSQLN
jgi:lipopolysaccharide export LptBFGC system permease protein LptF